MKHWVCLPQTVFMHTHMVSHVLRRHAARLSPAPKINTENTGHEHCLFILLQFV